MRSGRKSQADRTAEGYRRERGCCETCGMNRNLERVREENDIRGVWTIWSDKGIPSDLSIYQNRTYLRGSRGE